MGREVRRVALDFDFPLGETWTGFLRPDDLYPGRCPVCEGSGENAYGKHLSSLWYGYAPFVPADNGSVPFTVDTPAVRAFAERNVTGSPDFYGSGEWAIEREAIRLLNLWNGQWSHHLNQDDVDALIAEGRLMDLTHTWDPENRWQPIVPTPVITAAQVNEWSLVGFGHDGINQWVVVKARAAREGKSLECEACGGKIEIWRDEQHKADFDAWTPTDPPAGEGWQLWQTISEGGPVSPVFATSEGLVSWMMVHGTYFEGERGMSREEAEAFVAQGFSVGTFAVVKGEFMDGVRAVSHQQD